jgi:Insertion element 4 transposase N-terminal/Transposase DDE domain
MGAAARRFDIAEAGIGVLAEAFPLETVQAILAATGREGKRNRLLPASMMVYYVIALGLFVGVGCREVLRRLLDGATWIWPNQVRVATESAITQARQRLGSVPIERLYEEVVVPIAKKVTRGAWYRSWRVVTLDGSVLDIADSEENEKAFGRPGASRGRSAYPQTRVVGFVENGTHVLFGAEMDRYDVGETTIARRILKKLRSNMLCLADRNFLGYPLWKEAVATGAKLLWRAKLQLVIPKIRKLRDGSYVAKIYPSPKHRRRDRDGILVRLIDYRIDGFRETYRLVTNILEPSKAPALELARLYSERWTIETALDEIKTHLRGSNVVLRSKLPALVRQDVFALLLAHYGVRWVMHDAALSEDISTDELSFVHTLRVVHRKLPWFVSFPPSPAELRV